MRFVIRLLINALALWLTVLILHPHVQVSSWESAADGTDWSWPLFWTYVLLAVIFSALVMRPAWRQGWRSLTAFWSRHRRFPQYSLPADAVNTAAVQLPVMVVAGRFGAEAAGLLAMTLKTLGAPIGLLGKSVLDVFKRYAAAAWRDQRACSAAGRQK